VNAKPPTGDPELPYFVQEARRIDITIADDVDIQNFAPVPSPELAAPSRPNAVEARPRARSAALAGSTDDALPFMDLQLDRDEEAERPRDDVNQEFADLPTVVGLRDHEEALSLSAEAAAASDDESVSRTLTRLHSTPQSRVLTHIGASSLPTIDPSSIGPTEGIRYPRPAPTHEPPAKSRRGESLGPSPPDKPSAARRPRSSSTVSRMDDFLSSAESAAAQRLQQRDSELGGTTAFMMMFMEDRKEAQRRQERKEDEERERRETEKLQREKEELRREKKEEEERARREKKEEEERARREKKEEEERARRAKTDETHDTIRQAVLQLLHTAECTPMDKINVLTSLLPK